MKNILITGASSGIGKETALYFSKNNWNVIATMICSEHAKVLENLPNIHCYVLDVTSTESIEKAKNAIISNHKTIDVIINNAGIGYRSFVETADDAKINDIVNINWLGIAKVCRAFIPVFRNQKSGLFINISSIAGLVNLPLGSFYHSTKHAVESFSECMAYELMDFNVKVCTVQFGNTPSNFQKNVVKSEKSNVVSYQILMDKIDGILIKKTNKNKDFCPVIFKKLLKIAENPPKNFKRYTLGFDANLMKTLLTVLGYKWFNKAVIKFVLK